MANKSNFLMVSLEEGKAKKLAQVISNDTARKILDMLAEGNATESEISKSLKQPISTVHYNLNHLMDAKLVECKEFHYSPKGKEVNHYSLANKYIIIAPKAAKDTIKDKLKSLIPSLLIVAGLGFAYQFFSGIIRKTGGLYDTGEKANALAAPTTSSAPEAAATATETALSSQKASSVPAVPDAMIQQQEPNYVLWLVAGAISLIVLYLIIDSIRKRLKK